MLLGYVLKQAPAAHPRAIQEASAVFTRAMRLLALVVIASASAQEFACTDSCTVDGISSTDGVCARIIFFCCGDE